MGRKKKEESVAENVSSPPENEKPTETPRTDAPVTTETPAIDAGEKVVERPKDLLDRVVAGHSIKRPGPGRPKGSVTKRNDVIPVKPQETIDPETQEYAAEAVSELETEGLIAWTGDDSKREATVKILKTGWKYYLKVSGMPHIPGLLVVIIAHLAVVFGTNRKPVAAATGRLWDKMFPPKKKDEAKPAAGTKEAPSAEPDLTPPKGL